MPTTTKILRNGGGYILRNGIGNVLRNEVDEDEPVVSSSAGYFAHREPARVSVFSNFNVKSNLFSVEKSNVNIVSKLQYPIQANKLEIKSKLLAKITPYPNIYGSLTENQTTPLRLVSKLKKTQTSGLILEGKTNLEQIISLIRLYQILDDDK